MKPLFLLTTPTTGIKGGVQAKYRGPYQRIFKLLESNRIFTEIFELSYTQVGKNQWLLELDGETDGDEILRISEMKGVKVLWRIDDMVTSTEVLSNF